MIKIILLSCILHSSINRSQINNIKNLVMNIFKQVHLYKLYLKIDILLVMGEPLLQVGIWEERIFIIVY